MNCVSLRYVPASLPTRRAVLQAGQILPRGPATPFLGSSTFFLAPYPTCNRSGCGELYMHRSILCRPCLTWGAVATWS